MNGAVPGAVVAHLCCNHSSSLLHLYVDKVDSDPLFLTCQFYGSLPNKRGKARALNFVSTWLAEK